MSDFIREVDEEVRHDQFRRFWNAYWGFILVAVLAVLGGVGIWRFYSHYRDQQAEAAASRYIDALELSHDTPAASVSALEALAKDAPPGYRLLARLRAASETGRVDAVAGIKAFDAIATDPSVEAELQDVARLRAALLSIDSASPEELKRRLEPLADANATFRNVAREMLAVAALKAGDDVGAGRWLDAIVSDPVAASDARQRAGLFLGLVRAGKPAPTPLPPPGAPLELQPNIVAPPVEAASPALPAAPAPASPAVDAPPQPDNAAAPIVPAPPVAPAEPAPPAALAPVAPPVDAPPQPDNALPPAVPAPPAPAQP